MGLREFLEYVNQRYCGINLDPVTVDHIYKATSQIVHHVMDDLGKLKPHLNVKEVISVGSFAEETKILSVNEFDFMVCFDFLSKKENMRIESIKRCSPGYMMVFLNAALCNDSFVADNLYGDTWCIHREGLRMEFVKVLGEVIKSLSMRKIVTPQGILVIEGSKYLSISLKWYKFKNSYSGTEIYNELCEIDLPLNRLCTALNINVDIMPAVTVDDFSLLSDIHGFPEHMIGTKENQKFHLVSKVLGLLPNVYHLLISHATTEVYLVRHLHPIHKQCYKILKYLLPHGTDINRPVKDFNLSSYVFKTAMLFHEYDKLCRGPPDTVTCCIEVIQYIRARLREGSFPSFLMRKTNVWGQCYKFPVSHWWKPAQLDEEICSFDWCFVLWFQLLRQYLGKALLIFQKIDLQLRQTRETEPESQKGIPTDDSLPSVTSRSPGIVVYVPNEYDLFLDEFSVLREDMSKIISVFSNAGHMETVNMPGKPPSERVWELVLPKFTEYLDHIENLCKRKMSIPRENVDLIWTV